MTERESIVLPPIADLRKEIVTRQSELRHLRKMLLLAKAVVESTEPREATRSNTEAAG